MPVFAYADETVFDVDLLKGHKSLGCAIFLTDTEIKQELIDEALNNLRQQQPVSPKIQDSIVKTLNKKQFHASKDSNYAKQSFVDAINKHVKGILAVSYYDNPAIATSRDQEKFFERCMSSSSLEFFNSMEEVNLVIEQREGLSPVHVEEWKELIYRLFENSSFTLPSFKTYYPKINITIGDKTVPGLQVVDFLLWAVNRSRQIPAKIDWRKQLKFATQYHFQQEGSNHNAGHYYLNKIGLDNRSEYPVRFEKSETAEELLHAWILIERFFRTLEESDFTGARNHLYSHFVSVQRLFARGEYHLKENDLILIGRTFIRLFDSLPLYRHVADDNIESWTLLHHAKHIASIILAQGHIHCNRTRGYILRWRYNAQISGELEAIMAQK